MGRVIEFGDVERAERRISGRITRTPLLSLRSLSDRCGVEVLIKAECLQRSGSFKFRGALNAALSGVEQGDQAGVIAISSGNHAQAVALAAREAGLPATLVMLEGDPRRRQGTVRSYGAEVITQSVTLQNREDVGDAIHDDRSLRWIHPFDDAEMIAGDGTVATELLEQARALHAPPDLVLVPVGGGALLAGVGTALEKLSPSTRVIGVEPEIADDAARSLAAGRLMEFESQPPTVADATNNVHLGELPWPIISELIDEIVTVSETQILEAMWLLWTRAKLIVEPAGALALAPLLDGRFRPDGGAGRPPVAVCIASGGNVDLAAMMPRLADVLGPAVSTAALGQGTAERAVISPLVRGGGSMT